MSKLPRLALVFAFVLTASAASAQPYSKFLGTPSGASGYVSVPHSADLNFSTGFTFEAWVRVNDPSGGCKSIGGKDWTKAWWVGVCGTTLRSYLKGSGSAFTIGTVPPWTTGTPSAQSNWTHIAVTFDGTTHRHYIDGEEVGARAEAGVMTTSTTEMRILSDTAYPYSPEGWVDEVRLWNVARTKEQIRSLINKPATGSEPDLVALYHFDTNAADSSASGLHDGTLSPTGAGYFSLGSGGNCISNTGTELCLDGRFSVSVKWIVPDGTTGTGKVVLGASSNSGLFWFFSPDNWELLVKELDGCSLNDRRWLFSAATTNVHYKISVYDMSRGAIRQYLNYQGVSAPAVTDTEAFATCP